MSIQATLSRVRAKYGPSPTKDECASICNETAWLHRTEPERWGVSTKNAGSYGTLHDGSRIAADIIQNGVTKEGFDVLVAAGDGGPATPSWNSVGVISDPARPWKAPIAPAGTTEPGPDPTPCRFVPTDLAGIQAQLARLEGKVDALLAAGGGSVPDGVALAQRQEELADLTAQRIAASTAAILNAIKAIKSCIFR